MFAKNNGYVRKEGEEVESVTKTNLFGSTGKMKTEFYLP
jgi:hypothetical protein